MNQLERRILASITAVGGCQWLDDQFPTKCTLEFMRMFEEAERMNNLSEILECDLTGCVTVGDIYERAKKADGIRLLPSDGSTPLINRIERDDVERFQDMMDAPGHHSDNLIDEYQNIATKSAIYPGKGTPFGLMYAALGLAEAGEVQNKVKKAFRDDGVIDFYDYEGGKGVQFYDLTPERRKQIIKELGGALWYIAAVCDEIGATMSEVALTNLDELCSRGERGTLRGDGDNR